MMEELEKNRIRNADAAFQFWKDANCTQGMASLRPFNQVARAVLSSQASSALAERLFSELGRAQASQRQSLLAGSLEISPIIHSFILNELDYGVRHLHNSGLLHPRAAAFRGIVDSVAKEEAKMSECTGVQVHYSAVVKITMDD